MSTAVQQSLIARLVLVLLGLLAVLGVPGPAASTRLVKGAACEGTYPHHLQGVCRDGRGNLFWSFTTRLVKTDSAGKVRRVVEVANHHGDLCFLEGKLYVAVNLGQFNQPAGKADSWVYVYDAGDLSLRAKYPAPEAVHGAGGIAYHDGKFMLVGGLPPGVEENYVYEYDRNFSYRRRHVLNSGYTLMGIQTVTFADGHWWFGCYGEPKVTLRADAALRNLKRYEFDCSLGITGAGKGEFLVARGSCARGEGCRGELVPARASAKRGLELQRHGTGAACCAP